MRSYLHTNGICLFFEHSIYAVDWLCTQQGWTTKKLKINLSYSSLVRDACSNVNSNFKQIEILIVISHFFLLLCRFSFNVDESLLSYVNFSLLSRNMRAKYNKTTILFQNTNKYDSTDSDWKTNSRTLTSISIIVLEIPSRF